MGLTGEPIRSEIESQHKLEPKSLGQLASSYHAGIVQVSDDNRRTYSSADLETMSIRLELRVNSVSGICAPLSSYPT